MSLGLALSIAVLGSEALANNTLGPNKHWSDGNEPRAWMTIEDHTPSGWPVLAATNEWATEPNIDMYYVFGGCSGSPGRCVDVRVIDFGAYACTQFGGFFQPVVANNHYDPDSYIRFNDACGSAIFTNRDRRALACEEIGHSIGMDHAKSDLNEVTCMASGPINLLYEHPRQHDFDMLHTVIYAHNDP